MAPGTARLARAVCVSAGCRAPLAGRAGGASTRPR